MKIGKNTVPRTAICTSDEDTIVVRGHDLCRDLIGKVSFTEHFYLLLTGKRPTPAALAVLDATLVAIAEHGLVPSVQASRMTLAAAPDALQGAVAAGILGCGSVILGASETAGHLFNEVDAKVQAGASLDDAALAVVRAWRESRRAIAGYGHPLHKRRDPRVDALFAVAREHAIDLTLRRDRRSGRTGDPAGDRQGSEAQCLGRHPRGAAGDRLSSAIVARRADPGARRGTHRASAGGVGVADRLRAVLPGVRATSSIPEPCRRVSR